MIKYSENIGDMMEKSLKTYLMIPLLLTLFLANTEVQADESLSVPQENPTSSDTSLATPASVSNRNLASVSTSFESNLDVEEIEVNELINSNMVSLSNEELTSQEIGSSVTTNLERTSDLSINTQVASQDKSVETTTEREEEPLAASVVANPLTVTQKTEMMTVSYQDNIPKDSELLVAVWSNKDNQDDIQWYNLQNGQANIPYTNHWEYGLYHFHAYFRQKVTGKMTFIRSEEVMLDQPQLETKITTTSQRSFDITISNVPGYFHALYVPIWSEVNGQDDLIWYEGQKQSNGTYKVSVDMDNHKSSTGLYHIHYYEGKPNGKKVFVGQAIYNQPVPKAPSITIKSNNDRTFEVTICDIPQKYHKVFLPTWTSKNGQDDIKWYQPSKQEDGAYRVTIDLEHHQFETEGYQLHLYGESGDKKTFLGGVSYNQHKLETQTQVTKVSDDQFTVTVTNVPSYIDQVRIPTWNDKNGQDDIRWYIAKNQGNGTHSLTVNIRDHQYESGLYHIHVYGNAGRVENIFLNANTTYRVVTPKAETQIQALTDTSFEVTVKNIPSYINTILLPTWSSKGGQDDIKWYTGQKQKDGSYSLTVNSKDHNFDSGTYHVHIYGRTVEGRLLFLDDTKIEIKEISKPMAILSIQNVNHQKGTFDVIVSDIQSKIGVKEVQLPTWSETRGQDDIQWYIANKQENGTYKITVNASNHKYSSGKYHVHLYMVENNGRREFVGAQETNLNVTMSNLQVGSASQGNYQIVNKVIYLDAGHGGTDPGATYYGQQEKVLNLDMQNRLKSKLEALGYSVVLTRSDDQFVDLLPRSEKANQSNADLFISIHYNAATAPTVSGVETYYYQYYAEYPAKINKAYHNNAERLRLSASLASNIQSSVVGTSGAKNNGVKRNTFAVLRETTAPAVLLELGYLSNVEENRKIATVDYREKLANGIVKGITDYYKMNF